MIAALSFVWIILSETFAPVSVGAGIITSTLAFFYSKKHLPLDKIKGVSFAKLITYPIFLIWNIYKGAFVVLKAIVVGEQLDIFITETKLKNETLISILGDTITIIPGSIMLNVSGNEVTSLWLRPKNEKDIEELENPSEEFMGFIEERLIKAEES